MNSQLNSKIVGIFSLQMEKWLVLNVPRNRHCNTPQEARTAINLCWWWRWWCHNFFCKLHLAFRLSRPNHFRWYVPSFLRRQFPRIEKRRNSSQMVERSIHTGKMHSPALSVLVYRISVTSTHLQCTAKTFNQIHPLLSLFSEIYCTWM